MRALRSTQRWFLDEVRAASALPRTARRRAAAATVVLPSPTLAPDERVAIYGRMYEARLHECLEADFPVTVALLGHRRFATLVRGYLTRHPPSSWTLNRLGAALPAYVRTVDGLPRGALVRDVVAVERAMTEAFDAEDVAPLTPADVARVPAGAWAKARLVPSPSLRVLALSTPANRVVTAVRRDGRAPRRLPRGPTWVAVYRKGLVVWRLDLTRPMHAALSRLAAGRTLGAALAAAARVDDGDPSDLTDRVRRWFATWIDEGVFAAVRRAEHRPIEPIVSPCLSAEGAPHTSLGRSPRNRRHPTTKG